MSTTLEASPATEERIWSPRVNGTMLSRLAARADVPADRRNSSARSRATRSWRP